MLTSLFGDLGPARRASQVVATSTTPRSSTAARLRRHGDHGKHRDRGQRARPDHRPPRQRPRRHRLAGAGDPRALRGDARRPRDRDVDDHAARPGRRLGVVGRQGALRRRRPADRAAPPAREDDPAHDRDDRADDAGPPPGRHAAHLPRRRARARPGERRDPGRADGAQPDDGGHHRPDAAARDRRAARARCARRPACRPGAARTCCSSCRRTPTWINNKVQAMVWPAAAARAHRQRADDRRVVGLERDAQRLERGQAAAGLGSDGGLADARHERLPDQGRRARAAARGAGRAPALGSADGDAAAGARRSSAAACSTPRAAARRSPACSSSTACSAAPWSTRPPAWSSRTRRATEQSIDMELAAAACAQVLRAHRDAARSMGLTDPIDEVITTAGRAPRPDPRPAAPCRPVHRRAAREAPHQPGAGALPAARGRAQPALSAPARGSPRRDLQCVAAGVFSASALLASASAFSLQRSPLWPRDPAHA